MRSIVHAVRPPLHALALLAVVLVAAIAATPRAHAVVLVLDDPAPAAVPGFYRCTSPWCAPDRRDLIVTTPVAHPERIRAVVVY